MKRRFLSLLTAFALCLTLIPTTAFANDEERGEDVSPCICETACTEGVMNPDCPVCGAEDAQPEDCRAPKLADETGSTPTPEEDPVPAPGGADEEQSGKEQPDPPRTKIRLCPPKTKTRTPPRRTREHPRLRMMNLAVMPLPPKKALP